MIVPPLPPKNSLSSYAIAGTNPSKAKEDASLVSRRKRMLGVFLNRCNAHKVLRNERVFKRFLEKDVPWSEVINSPPVTLLPKNQLRAPASDPTSSALLTLFAALPLPTSGQSLNSPDQRFLDSESFTNKFSNHLAGSLEKVNRRLMKRWNEVAGDWGEMGGGLNGFALRMGEEGDGGLEEATEKVGMAVDGGYTSTNVMVRSFDPLILSCTNLTKLQAWEKSFTEPLAEYTQFSGIIKSLLKYRHMKHVQYEMTRELLEVKKSSLEELERSELEAQRLEKALERVRIVSEDGNSTERVIPRGEEGPVGAGSVALGGAKKGGFGLLGALSHTFHGMVDVDPESSRRNSIGKTRESIQEVRPSLLPLYVANERTISWRKLSKRSRRTYDSRPKLSSPTSIDSNVKKSLISDSCVSSLPNSTGIGPPRYVTPSSRSCGTS